MTPSEELAAHRAELRVLNGAVNYHRRALCEYLAAVNKTIAEIQRLENLSDHCAEIARLEREQKEKELKA